MLYLALPELSADLGASTTQQLWMLDIYSFVLAGFLVTMGAVGDRIGRKRLLLVGAVAFGDRERRAPRTRRSPGQLIFWRAVLGIAGATLMPSTMGCIRTMFTDEKRDDDRDRGLVLVLHGWHGRRSARRRRPAPALLVGLGVPARRAVHGAARRRRPPRAARVRAARRREGRRRQLGRCRSPTILPVIYGFKEIARGGDTTDGPDDCCPSGLAIGLVFVRRQRRIANPLVDLTLFRSRAFSTALAVMLVGGVVMAGVSFLRSQWLQLVAGLSTARLPALDAPGQRRAARRLVDVGAGSPRRLGTARTMAPASSSARPAWRSTPRWARLAASGCSSSGCA